VATITRSLDPHEMNEHTADRVDAVAREMAQVGHISRECWISVSLPPPASLTQWSSHQPHGNSADISRSRTASSTPSGQAPTGGKAPRNFAIGPSGKYLPAADQKSNQIVVFRIDPDNGGLTPTGERIEVETPMGVKFASF